MAGALGPLAIQLEVEFLDRLSEPVREGKVDSVSALIRAALERFDLENIVVVRPPQLQISVRLPAETRRELRRVARAKHASVGQLVRAAVEAYLPRLAEETAGQLEIPIAAEPPPPRRRPAPKRRRRAAPPKKRGRAMTKKRKG